MADGLDIAEMMKRAVQANAKFYKGWMDLSLEYFKGISEIIAGPGQTVDAMPEMDSGSNALILEGEAGQLARGSFLVTNDLERALSCAFVSSDFRDHANLTTRAAPVFDPPAVQLGAGEQRVIQVAVAIDEALSPGVGYAGEFSIKGMEGFAVPVVLRRQHTVGAAEPVAPPTKKARERPSRQNQRAKTSAGTATAKKGRTG